MKISWEKLIEATEKRKERSMEAMKISRERGWWRPQRREKNGQWRPWRCAERGWWQPWRWIKRMMGVLLNLRRYQEESSQRKEKHKNGEESLDECMKNRREKVESSDENEEIPEEDSNERVEAMKHLILTKKLKRWSVQRFIASSLLVSSFAETLSKRNIYKNRYFYNFSDIYDDWGHN